MLIGIFGRGKTKNQLNGVLLKRESDNQKKSQQKILNIRR